MWGSVLAGTSIDQLSIAAASPLELVISVLLTDFCLNSPRQIGLSRAELAVSQVRRVVLSTMS